jgi:hypothetical protein
MEKKRIIFITLTLIIITMPVTITSGQTTSSQLLDNLQVSSNGSYVTSNIALQNGVSYQIVVSGTYFTVKGDLTQNNQQDAMYGTQDKWTTHYSTSDGLYIDRWSIGSKQWGAYNSDHNYQCSLVGNGSKVSFWVYSASYNGNSGSLTVQILGSPVPPSPSAPTPTPTSPTPTMTVTQTPSTSIPAGTSPSPDSSPTTTNSHNTSPSLSPTNPPIVTASPNQNSGSLFEGPVTVVMALVVSAIVVSLVFLLLSKRKRT